MNQFDSVKQFKLPEMVKLIWAIMKNYLHTTNSRIGNEVILSSLSSAVLIKTFVFFSHMVHMSYMQLLFKMHL